MSEQQPIAWMYDWQAEGEIVRDWMSQDYDEAHSTTLECHNIRPLYTRPQAQWVGLTEEEVQDSYNRDYQAQTRAIEQLLKEKNGGV